jgi:hypothetical protein
VSQVTVASSKRKGSTTLFLVKVHRIVYREKMQNMNKLRDRIVRAAECVTSEMLGNTWRDTECRLDVRRATNEHKNSVKSSVLKCIGFSNALNS